MTSSLLPSEATPLMTEQRQQSDVEAAEERSTTTSTAGSDVGSEDSRVLWHELEEPWPSTYARSISLLASPKINTQQAALYIKSPKPGSTPLALARRQNLTRGYYTPEAPTMLGRFRSGSVGGSVEIDFDRLGVHKKMQSLDFGINHNLAAVQKEQHLKAKHAKEYRKMILLQQQQQQQDGAVMSPGYGREREVALRKKASDEMAVAAAAAAVDGKSTLAQCAFNLANILMGVGLLALPFALKSAGWYGGLFCVLSFAFITWRTSILIGRELNGDVRPAHMFIDSPYKSPLQPGSTPEARMYAPIQSFPDIARAAFGDTGCFLLSCVLYFELFSCICIFFVTMGDHLHQLFPSIAASVHAFIVAGVSMVPTILLRTPTLLSYLSMVGTFATVAVVLSVVASAIMEGDVSEKVADEIGLDDAVAKPFHVGWESSGLAMSFGLVAYCFSGHAIVPSIYTSMKRPQDFEKMVTATFVVVVIACLAVGGSGYYMFGSTVQDQITLSLERSSKAQTFMKALTWLMILTAFSKTTLTMFPLALGMEELVAPYLTSERMVDLVSAAIKLVLTVSALAVAVYVPSFSLLCALVGMICTMAVSVIFPAAAHFKMFGPKLSWMDKVLDILFVVFGIVIAIAGTIETV